MPLGEHPLAPVPSGSPQVPVPAPPTLTQLPLQHSALNAQMSPFWVQNETAPEHRPPLQKFEQHSLFSAHGLPDVRHDAVGLTEPQMPPPFPSGEQMPLQQSSFL